MGKSAVWATGAMALAVALGAAGPAAASGTAHEEAGDIRVEARWEGLRATPTALSLTVTAGERTQRWTGLQRGGWGVPAAGPIVALEQLDEDPGLEAVLITTNGGVRCCLRTHVVDGRADGSLRVRVKRWGAAGFRLVDLDRDGRREFVSGDDRIVTGLRVPPPALSYPIQIWRLTDGGLRDVSGEFPRQLRADMAEQWRTIGRLVRAGATPRAAIAAYLADAVRLGERDRALLRLRARFTDRATRADIVRIDRRLRALGHSAPRSEA